mmetsp:Transcript_30350/g.55458  ORF Transcript_30350/g.55458 Transcript_30350/m.55458 type:complete len:205 (+) Transcript_30350:1063-1677(+)
MWSRDVKGVSRETVAPHLGVDLGPPRQGVVEVLEDEHTRPLAHNEPVSPGVERTRHFLGRSPSFFPLPPHLATVAQRTRQRTQLAESRNAQCVDARLRCTGNHHVGLPPLNQGESVADGMGTRGTRCRGAVVWATKTPADAYGAGGEVGENPGHEERGETPVTTRLRQQSSGGNDLGRTTHTAADDDSGVSSIALGFGNPIRVA